MHILLIMEEVSKPKISEAIDSIVCDELPDKLSILNYTESSQIAMCIDHMVPSMQT